MKTIDMTTFHTGGGGCLRQDITLERLFKKYFARLFNKRTTLFRSFSIRNSFERLNKFYGFTLAEVLITLGIIGIVAALTLPTIVQKQQEKVLLTKVKKAYSVILSAINAYKAEFEVTDVSSLFDTGNSSYETLDNFSKYFKVIKKCETSKGCGGYYYVKPMTKTPNGNGGIRSTGLFNKPRFILSDGMIISIQQYSNCLEAYESPVYDENGDPTGEVNIGYRRYCALLYFDVNGPAKPNQVGRDYFCFGVREDGTIYDPKTSNCGNISSVFANDKLNDVENYNLNGSYK